METYWFVFVTIFLVALVQVPIGVDLVRFMFPEWRIARLASRAAQAVLFTVMGIIYCIGLSYHLFVYLPLIAEGPWHTVKGLLHLAFALWVWINVVVNYYMAVFIHPGGDRLAISTKTSGKSAAKNGQFNDNSVKEDCTAEKNDAQNRGTSLPSNTGGDNVGTVMRNRNVSSAAPSHQQRHSPKSGVEWKPIRNQTCKICQYKVHYMDHHCPFTGSCVGLNNYSYFFLGLCYGVIGLGYAVIVTAPYFYHCNMKNILWYSGIVRDRGTREVCVQLGPHSHIFLPVVAGFCLALNIFILQVIFLLADLSTYNVLKDWSKYPMFHFAWQRMRAGKCKEPDSRLRVLVTSQRRNVLMYLIPVWNSG